jgi:hypothetical protein
MLASASGSAALRTRTMYRPCTARCARRMAPGDPCALARSTPASISSANATIRMTSLFEHRVARTDGLIQTPAMTGDAARHVRSEPTSVRRLCGCPGPAAARASGRAVTPVSPATVAAGSQRRAGRQGDDGKCREQTLGQNDVGRDHPAADEQMDFDRRSSRPCGASNGGQERGRDDQLPEGSAAPRDSIHSPSP